MHIFDPKWENDRIAAGGAFDFADDLTRFVRLTAQQQNEYAALVDRVDNRQAVIFSRHDVAGCDPTRYAVRFKVCAESFRDRKISGGMTDEDDSFHQQ